MRLSTTLIATVWIGLSSVAPGAQSEWIRGPILGFAEDSAGAAIRPIIGVPGASALGELLEFDTDIRGAVISPGQDYALAIRSEDASLVVIDLSGGLSVLSPIPGTRSGPDAISISPAGSAAVVYYDESRTVQVIAGLPRTPALVYEFDASVIPGRRTGVAVSDDGAVVLVRSVKAENSSLWRLDSSGAWIVSSEPVSAMAFFPNRHDAIVATTAEDATPGVFLIMDVDRTAARIPLISPSEGISAVTSVAVSRDSHQVLIADGSSGSIMIVDMETRRPVLVPCHCRLTGLYPLKGKSMFRLTEVSRGPIAALDASTSEPQVLLIPARSSRSEAQ